MYENHDLPRALFTDKYVAYKTNVVREDRKERLFYSQYFV